jgi:hypothetical protein
MLLRWLQKDLAEKSGISLPVVKRIETEPGDVFARQTTIEAFRKAFEKEGIRFIGGHFRGAVLRENRGEPDTGLRKSPLKRAKTVRAVFKKRAHNPKR